MRDPRSYRTARGFVPGVDVGDEVVADLEAAGAHGVADCHQRLARGAQRDDVGDRRLLLRVRDQLACQAVAIGLAEAITERTRAALVPVTTPEIALGVLDPLGNQRALELR